MTREQKRLLENIEKRIASAHANGDLLALSILIKQRSEILLKEQNLQRVTLRDAMRERGFGEEERIHLTNQVIVGIVISDILVSATMDIEGEFRRYGIAGVPVMEDIRKACKTLKNAVYTIDSIGDGVFSDRYAEVADMIEDKVMGLVKREVTEELSRHSVFETERSKPREDGE